MRSKSYWILCSVFVVLMSACATGRGVKLRSGEDSTSLLKKVTIEGWDEGVVGNALGMSLISQSMADNWLKLPESERPKAVFDAYCRAGQPIRSLKASFLVPLPRLQGEVVQTVNRKRKEYLEQVRYLLKRDWLFALAAKVEDRGIVSSSNYSKFTAIPGEWAALPSWIKDVYTNGAASTRCESPADSLEIPAQLDQDKNLRCRLMLVENSGKPIWLAPHAPVGFLEQDGEVLVTREKYPDVKAEFAAGQMVGSRYSSSGSLQSGYPQLIPGPASPGVVFEHGGKTYTGLRSSYFVEARTLIEGFTFVFPKEVYAREFPSKPDINGNVDQEYFGYDDDGRLDLEAVVRLRSEMWGRFVHEKSVLSEAATKDPGVIQFNIALDPGLACQYARPVQDLVSR